MYDTLRMCISVSSEVVSFVLFSCLARGKGDSSGSAAGSTYGSIGAQAYNTYCAGCHGVDGKKGAGASSHLGGQSADKIYKIARSGKGNMPAFGRNVIDDSTLRALANYASSLR